MNFRISDAALAAELGRFVRARRGKGKVGVREYAAWAGRRYGQNTIIKRFGSWAAAMARVGVEDVKQRNIDSAALVAEFERVWRELGRMPGETTLPRHGRFSLSAYKRRWGSPRALGELLLRERSGKTTRAMIVRAGEKRSQAVSAGAGRKTIPLPVRWEVMKRDRYACRVCGRCPSGAPGLELHIDHIVPVSRGGTNEKRNLRVLCRDCNVGRGDERRRAA